MATHYSVHVFIISAGQWLIVINCIQNKSFCVYNICVCTVYIYYVYINTHTCMYIFKQNMLCLYVKYIIWKWKVKVKVTWHDMWPSMVTHTQNLCSAFNPSKCTHTPWTHTRSSGQPFSWGFLLKGTSVVVLRVERALYIHSLHLQFLPDLRREPWPLDYESDSLTIRPRLPIYIYLNYMNINIYM